MNTAFLYSFKISFNLLKRTPETKYCHEDWTLTKQANHMYKDFFLQPNVQPTLRISRIKIYLEWNKILWRKKYLTFLKIKPGSLCPYWALNICTVQGFFSTALLLNLPWNLSKTKVNIKSNEVLWRKKYQTILRNNLEDHAIHEGEMFVQGFPLHP